MPPGVKTIRIWELRLINVKSYSDETLRFQPGINFISGINGAGKTTIIESIGYALFNYNPYSLRHFLREGAKSGEIQVLLEALDERLYRIVRKFNSRASTKWEVWDEESDTVLDELHGAEDVSLWIKRSIGLGDSDNLPDLFSQVIAVEQGLFTAPFLDTVTSRRQTFDRILKVEGYRQAFQRSSSIESHFANTQKLVAQEITFLETMLRPLPELEEKITRGLEKLQAEKQALLLEQARVKELAVQVQQFHEKRDQIRDLEKDYALIQTEISSGRQQSSNQADPQNNRNKCNGLGLPHLKGICIQKKNGKLMVRTIGYCYCQYRSHNAEYFTNKPSPKSFKKG
jgi:exonuclease SbcC